MHIHESLVCRRLLADNYGSISNSHCGGPFIMRQRVLPVKIMFIGLMKISGLTVPIHLINLP